MKIARTERFKKAWGRLTETEREPGRKAIENLATDIRHPGLRVKKIAGTVGIWEARASISLRLTFEVRGDLITLRNIGPHDQTLERP